MKLTFILLLLLSSQLGIAQQLFGSKDDINKIVAASKAFSEAYVSGDIDKMTNIYTLDAKIFPGGTEIIGGREKIRKQWTLPVGDKITRHVATPGEIRVVEEFAYDYGYYEGETLKANGETQKWKGKYVIVWKKVNEEWLMYLDIWNRVL